MNSTTSSLPKIALAGPKGGGKTYLMNEVGKQLEHKLQAIKLSKSIPGVGTIAFADPIYHIQACLFDYLDHSKLPSRAYNENLKLSGRDESIHPVIGMSPRNFRQTFGTEYCRSMNKDIWLNIAAHKIELALKQPSSGLILLDVRFPNEVDYCKENDFLLVYVNAMRVPEQGSHDSESHSAYMKSKADYIVTAKPQVNLMVDKIVDMLVDYIGENYTESGLIIPKGKLN